MPIPLGKVSLPSYHPVLLTVLDKLEACNPSPFFSSEISGGIDVGFWRTGVLVGSPDWHMIG